jgi:hypothetical protein
MDHRSRLRKHDNGDQRRDAEHSGGGAAHGSMLPEPKCPAKTPIN